MQCKYFGVAGAERGAQLFSNGKAHSTDEVDFPFPGKGVGGEFEEEIRMMHSGGKGPKGIFTALRLKYGPLKPTSDDKKLGRIPVTATIKGFVQTNLSKSSGLLSNVDLSAQENLGVSIRPWSSSRRVSVRNPTCNPEIPRFSWTQVDLLAITHNKSVETLADVYAAVHHSPLCLRNFCQQVKVAVYDDDDDLTGEYETKTTLGFVLASRKQILYLRDLLVSLRDRPRPFTLYLQADGTYKLSKGTVKAGAVLVDLGIHDITYDPKNDKDSHNFLPLMYMFCQTECFEAYRVLFMTLRDLPHNLFEMPGVTINPVFGGLDRASYIAKAYLEVWPTVAETTVATHDEPSSAQPRASAVGVEAAVATALEPASAQSRAAAVATALEPASAQSRAAAVATALEPASAQSRAAAVATALEPALLSEDDARDLVPSHQRHTF